MHLRPVSPEPDWTVRINWSRPVTYENTIDEDYEYGYNQDHWLYMILGCHGASPRKIFYIGKVYNSFVGNRLQQDDHRQRYQKLRKQHPNHRLRVSLGTVHIKDGHITKQRIDQIETMLIYTVGEKLQHIINRNKLWTVGITDQYVIHNSGYHRPLPEVIQQGIFIG